MHPLGKLPFFMYTVACNVPMANDDLTVTVINYTAPALEGSVIAIKCDALSTNYYTSTCVEGRWEPDLAQISARCEGMFINNRK